MYRNVVPPADQDRGAYSYHRPRTEGLFLAWANTRPSTHLAKAAGVLISAQPKMGYTCSGFNFCFSYERF
jgi:hypothetical protein